MILGYLQGANALKERFDRLQWGEWIEEHTGDDFGKKISGFSRHDKSGFRDGLDLLDSGGVENTGHLRFALVHLS